MSGSGPITCTYYIESDGPPEPAAAMLAGEQSSGTFIKVPTETRRIHDRHAARVTGIEELGDREPSLPSRSGADRVRAAEITVEFPMENVSGDIATLLTTVSGNLFELAHLYGCRLRSLTLPSPFIAAHPGPAFGIEGTRRLLGRPEGPLIGTIVKPNVGLDRDEYRRVVRGLARAGLDLIKDDELMTDPDYLPLADRVRIATEEITAAEQVTGHHVMYAFNISGNLTDLRRRHDLVVAAGGDCVMMNVPAMGLPALEWLRSFAQVPIHGHRAGLAASMRHPALGVDFTAWQQLARLAGADHIHASGLGGKFYETDEQVATNIRSLLRPLGDTIAPLATLSSGQTVHTPSLTHRAVGSLDVLMLAGGGVAAHPAGPAAGVRSLRQAWEAAVAGQDVTAAADRWKSTGDTALAEALAHFPAGS
ncbi:ribulose-bisphosphate carboxylase large chain [Stackebrandtia endophytica]|uniref:Ribulose-bisphosphate carboxylase large chain n=1 Tax=Stackebrandtia endophytica TaxID=1496996 RepID=A0A543AYF8_9ACTN|nr:RuBisCO large subunit C-terminal-like domain-containing protein [Stackebrandtia endophytica]TQL77603.1 ribulose-bisphosphate carboxylase large chain [Stackebrandtia endophytica]